MTREEWLQAAVADLRDGLFKAQGHKVPKVHVSVGFPGGGGKSRIGECWAGKASADGTGHIFVSPTLGDAVEVLAVLVHELVHAINHAGGETGHGKVFADIAKPLGLEGKMTATVAGAELQKELKALAKRLGKFPHAALTRASGLKAPKSRSGRYVKVECSSGDDFEVRMSASRLESYGPPSCPCHGEAMVAA